jgi:hypothetical protein
MKSKWHKKYKEAFTLIKCWEHYYDGLAKMLSDYDGLYEINMAKKSALTAVLNDMKKIAKS